jgi:ABC-type sugar transport system permease subunit
MSLAGLLLWTLVGLWVAGGSAWLLARRRYRAAQAPRFLMDLLGFPVELAQATWGRAGVPYAFLMPNMLIFGLFTFLPMLLNFWVSLTSGESISLLSRPFAGLANYADIFACESILSPNTCSNAGLNFWTAMGNTLVFVAIQVPVLVIAALLTALVLNRHIRGRGFWRAMFFYPVMLSPVVIANIWKWVLHRKGMLNEGLAGASDTLTALAGMSGFDLVATVLMAILLLLSAERTLRAGREPSLLWGAVLGILVLATVLWANPAAWILATPGRASLWLGLVLVAPLLWLVARAHRRAAAAVVAASAVSAALLLTVQFGTVFDLGAFRPVNWLVTPNSGWPFFWLVFVFCWAHMGFYMLILLAGLQAIPADLYEAARMDAARPLRTFFRITLPLLVPTLTVVVILALIRSFQMFDEAYLLTGGGPGRETFLVVQNIFQAAFTGDHPDYGEAAAGSVLMAAVIAVFTLGQLVVTRRQSGL